MCESYNYFVKLYNHAGYDKIYLCIYVMLFYYYLLSFIALSGIFMLIRFFVMRKKNIAVELFAEALRNENSGDFEAAEAIYTKALHEVKKIRFHRKMEVKIIEKIKVLHTVMDYKNSLHFTRIV